MPKYRLTDKSVEDLGNIWSYTYDEWSESQADKYYNLLKETCQKLASDSMLGKNYEELISSLKGFRVGKHVNFYRIVTGDEIEIVRILHERMDLERYIF